ncbi:MAG: iron ABC transporter permease [Sphaerochaetaceae bacterium]|nr:iron ABC transporter permease [Sphaerochaetaceae bacterium]
MKKVFTFSWFNLAYAIATLFLVVFLIFPIIRLFTGSFSMIFGSSEPLPPGFFSYLLRVTGNTLNMALMTTVIAVLIAVPLGFLIAKLQVPGASVFLGVLSIPLITPAFISSFATIILLGNSGVITMFFELFGINLPSIYGLRGLVITQVLHAMPYALLLVITGLKTVPRHLEEASISLGNSALKTQFSIVLPYIAPHILMAALMVFLTSMGDVGGPLIIGGSYQVISTEIYNNFITYMGDERIPIIFGAWTLILSFLMLFIVSRLMKLTDVKHRFRIGQMTYDRPRARKAGLLTLIVVSILFLAPYIAIVIQSFGTIWAYDWLPKEFTTNNYVKALSDILPIRNTIILLMTVTPILIILSVIFAHMFKNRKMMRWVNYFTLMPFTIPGVIIAVSLLESYAGVSLGRRDLIASIYILIIAISIRRLPFVLKIIEAGFSKIDDSQQEAAFSLGATEVKAFFSVILPQLKPAISMAVVIGMIKVVTELSSSLMLNPPGWRTMSLYIAYFVEEGFISRAAAMGIVLIAIVGIGTAISNNMKKRNQ